MICAPGALALALALALPLTAQDAPPAPPPNLILVVADDLGREWLSCYGGEVLRTPHLDALATAGTRLQGIYSMPICTPSRATLLLGQYPWRHGWVDHWDVPRFGGGCHLDPEHNVSFARVLRDAGYATAIAGKWQINDFRVQPDVLDAHGFDEWCVWTGYETGNPPSAERYWEPYVQTREGRGTREGRFGDDVFLDFALDFLRRHEGEPALVYLPLCLPHPPYVPTPRHPNATGDRSRYMAMVRHVDAIVGRLVAALDELELRDRTVVLFTTDNGSPSAMLTKQGGRVVRGGKGELNEAGTRVPLIAAGAGIAVGQEADALCDFTDLFPTLLDLAGVAIPEGLALDGVSLAPVLRGETRSSGRTYALTMGGGQAVRTEAGVRPRQRWADRALVDGRYKLWLRAGQPWRLYDLASDPGEERNLVQSENPEQRRALRTLLQAAAALPAEDAAPRYSPTAPQPWDRPIRPAPGGEGGDSGEGGSVRDGSARSGRDR